MFKYYKENLPLAQKQKAALFHKISKRELIEGVWPSSAISPSFLLVVQGWQLLPGAHLEQSLEERGEGPPQQGCSAAPRQGRQVMAGMKGGWGAGGGQFHAESQKVTDQESVTDLAEPALNVRFCTFLSWECKLGNGLKRPIWSNLKSRGERLNVLCGEGFKNLEVCQ